MRYVAAETIPGKRLEMAFTLEALVVAVFAILPGFISAAARSSLTPTERASVGEWVAGSIVTSLVINVIAMFLFVQFHKEIDLNKSIGELVDIVKNQSGSTALEYMTVIYSLAVTWGVLGGLESGNYAPRVLAYRFRLTPVAPVPNVFEGVIGRLVRTPENPCLAGDPKQKAPWLRVQRKGIIVFGRLRDSSVDYEVNEPIEVFVSPAYLLGDARENFVRYPREEVRGLYFRILPDDIVEVLTMSADWVPEDMIYDLKQTDV
jgi:hypothetical protein